MILTSKRHAEHPFAGQNTQHPNLVTQKGDIIRFAQQTTDSFSDNLRKNMFKTALYSFVIIWLSRLQGSKLTLSMWYLNTWSMHANMNEIKYQLRNSSRIKTGVTNCVTMPTKTLSGKLEESFVDELKVLRLDELTFYKLQTRVITRSHDI